MTAVAPSDRRFPRHRRHTLAFLHTIRADSPVHLDAEVDLSALATERAARADPPSVFVYVLHAVGRVLARHPDAAATLTGPAWWPRLVRGSRVDAKVTLDQWVDGERVVVTAVVPDVDVAGREFLRARLARLRDAAPGTLPETAGASLLARLPVPLGRAALALAVRGAGRRRRFGSVAVTSLGHRRVQRFFSSGGTAVTIGLGRVTDRPVARDGRVRIVPVLPLSLTFDHRVLDGAAAADVLDDLVSTLEAPPVPEPGP
ncbi:2-oxo acid dehydrogenase subunit E2 [Pseudonocardia alni]|uniref:2-oxo acid dehydrogenase subunit E2 n=1 Tax=Pseudonocardia alni TaxID=33907 RepID=UPI0036C102D9